MHNICEYLCINTMDSWEYKWDISTVVCSQLKSHATIIVINLCVALIIGNLIFLTGISRTEMEVRKLDKSPSETLLSIRSVFTLLCIILSLLPGTLQVYSWRSTYNSIALWRKVNASYRYPPFTCIHYFGCFAVYLGVMHCSGGSSALFLPGCILHYAGAGNSVIYIRCTRLPSEEL